MPCAISLHWLYDWHMFLLQSCISPRDRPEEYQGCAWLNIWALLPEPFRRLNPSGMARNKGGILLNRFEMSCKDFSIEISEIDLSSLDRLSDAITRALDMFEDRFGDGSTSLKDVVLSEQRGIGGNLG